MVRVAGIDVCLAEHTVSVRARGVFGDLDAPSCRRFVRLALEVAGVDAVDVDARSATAAVRHRIDRAGIAGLLRLLADTLRDGGHDEVGPTALSAADGRLRGFRWGDTSTSWEVIACSAGQAQLEHDGLATWAIARHVRRRVEAEFGVEDTHVAPWTRRLTVHHDPAVRTLEQLLPILDEAVNEARAFELHRPADEPRLRGLRRMWHLALAAVSFGLAVLGVIVPGLPTIPFLLLTSYFLAGSSPRLAAKLESSRVFGPMIRDWRQYRGMRRATKRWVLAIMAVVLVLTLLSGAPSLPVLMLILVVMAIVVRAILRLPEVPEEPRSGTGFAIAATAT